MGRAYFSLLAMNGNIKGVLDIGTYYYDNADKKENGEFDIALKKKDGYEIFEAKYYINEMSEIEMLEEEKQINSIKEINIKKIGFITISGIEKKIDRFDYIDGEELYSIDTNAS